MSTVRRRLHHADDIYSSDSECDLTVHTARPVAERIVTPKSTLLTAEHLFFSSYGINEQTNQEQPPTTPQLDNITTPQTNKTERRRLSINVYDLMIEKFDLNKG